MSWSIGFDTKWNRDIGYGVPAWCDHPECSKKIDRGLAFVCGGPYWEPDGCGLYFCDKHIFCNGPPLCERCLDGKEPFTPKPDHPEWIEFKATDESWAEWRKEVSA